MTRTGLVVVVALVVLAAALTQARYLPTRADDTRLDEIRELLREMLERTAEGANSRISGSGYDKRFMYKRSVPEEGAAEMVQPALNLPQ
ncbi:uncharacterized protein LOC121878128 [Homarus americanus]|uniref:uncharacterized protein LOC121878128 n=1 Tax=Homarus americanus TaxID=6706 RepID=UPI001C46EF0A|nr:uncharacterized protein LOC121878128 [Homarus americanus]